MPNSKFFNVPPMPDIGGYLPTQLNRLDSRNLVAGLTMASRIDNRFLYGLIAELPPLEFSSEILIAIARRAIYDATWYEVKSINHNFSYDRQAYYAVAKLFHQLADRDKLEALLELTGLLISAGDSQMEAGDEGMTRDEIEMCVNVTLDALEASSFTPEQLRETACALRCSAAGTFICHQRFEQLTGVN